MDAGNTLADVQARLSAAVGRTAWGTALGIGSFLTVEFGDRIERPQGKAHGEFHLWVYQSAWRIEMQGAVLASSEDPREALEESVRYLDGRALTAIAIEAPSLSATFSFTDGLVLRTFSVFTADVDHWMFYLPGGDVFTAGPGPTWIWSR
ncbi:hypothetical protein ABGB07_42540 [Micromonosporaceae bacterium B7E4]